MPDDIPPHAEPAAGASAFPPLTTTPGGAPRKFPLALIAGFAAIALLGAVIVMILRGPLSPPPADTAAVAKVKGEIIALRDEYNRDLVSAGKQPIGGDSESIQDIATRLKKDTDSLVALASTYQGLIAEQDERLAAKSAEVLRGETLRANLLTETARLQTDLNDARASGSNSQSLQRALAGANARAEAGAAELDAARERIRSLGKGVAAEDYADLKRRLEETVRAKEFFEARVKELEGAVSQSKLFAESEGELVPAAVELFRGLRQLGDGGDTDISASYKDFETRLGASVAKNVAFATGSSALSAADEEALRGLVEATPDGDLLIAIGYASVTGNADANRTLSSDRATAVARFIGSVKRPGQLTQAVYFGQTSRFGIGVPERNQIVEIWRIRGK